MKEQDDEERELSAALHAIWAKEEDDAKLRTLLARLRTAIEHSVSCIPEFWSNLQVAPPEFTEGYREKEEELRTLAVQKIAEAEAKRLALLESEKQVLWSRDPHPRPVSRDPHLHPQPSPSGAGGGAASREDGGAGGGARGAEAALQASHG